MSRRDIDELLLVREYSTLCQGNDVIPDLFLAEDFWKLELAATSFSLETCDSLTLRRLVYCISRLKQLRSNFKLEDLDSSFSQLLEKTGDRHRGCVLSFGKNDFQLGFGSDNSLHPIPHRIQNDKRVSFEQISASRFHTMAVSAEGDLYSWGKGQGGKLGHGTEETYIIPTKLSLPLKVLSIATGRHHSMAILEDGSLYTWGSNKYGQLGLGNVGSILTPTKVNVDKKKGYSGVVCASASNSHSMCVREDGSVFCWGKNDSSQLGFRSLTSCDVVRNTPFKLPGDAFQSLVPVRCSISDSISLLLTQDGKVFQWGKGSPKPTKVVFSRETPDQRKSKDKTDWNKMKETSKSIVLTAISTAPYHSAAISNYGEVFTWGSEANLLGYRTKSHTTIGRRVNFFFDKGIKIESIACAKRHSVVVDNKGFVYVWGHGDHGVLGLTEKQTYQPEPKVIPSLRAVKAVSAAECHTCVIVKERQPFVEEANEKQHINTEVATMDYSSDQESVSTVRNIEAVSVVESQEVKTTVIETLQERCQSYLLKEADMWNILNYLSFGLRYSLSEIIKFSELLILLNFSFLTSYNRDYLSSLAMIYGFKQLLKQDITLSNTVSIQRRRYSISSVSSIASTNADVVDCTSAKVVVELKKPILEKKAFKCDICNISTSSNNALIEHLAGKKHKKKAQEQKKFHFQVASPVTPKYEPSRPKPEIIETITSQTRFQLNDSDFPKPSRALTPIAKKETSGHQTPKRYITNSGYSLSDFLNKRKGKPVVKPNPWKKEDKGARSTLSSIMLEQSNEVKVDSCLKQSSWGYNKVKKENLQSIQQEQIQENIINQQKRLLRKFKRQRAKARKKKLQEKLKAVVN